MSKWMKLAIFNVVIIFLWISCGDKEPPVVEITNPTDGAYVNGTVLVTAEATDNEVVDSVEIFIDDTLVAGFAKPYAYYWWATDSLLHNSAHYLYARAYDASENVGISDTVSVTVQHSGTLKWRYQTGDWIASSPALGSDGTIYFASQDDYLYALNSNGSLKWKCEIPYDPNYPAVFSSPALASDGTIYIARGDTLYALNSNGSLKWKYRTGIVEGCSPAVGIDGTIYISAFIRQMVFYYYFYAINPDGTLKWYYEPNVFTGSPPVIGSDGTIYFGTDGLYALNPDGTLKWSFTTGGYVQSSPAIGSDGTIYFGSGSYLYALTPDGTLKWQYQAYCASPAIGSDGIIYFGAGSYLYALTPDGTIKWGYQTGGSIVSSPALGSDGTIYFGSNDGYLYALNPDGTLKWRYQTGSGGSSPAIGNDGTIYVGAGYYLYAINGTGHLADSPWPKFRHDLKNTGRVGGN